MFKLDAKKIIFFLSAFLVIEILSFLVFSFPVLNQTIFILLIMAALGLTIYKLEYGVLLVLTELLIGSLGHLFVGNFVAVQVPIRMALWAIVILVFTIKLIIQLFKQKQFAPYWLSLKKFSGWKPFLLLFFFIIVSLINAYWRGHSLNLIFSDFNAWLYFFFLVPLIIVYNESNSEGYQRLQNLFFAAAIWLSLKTLFLLFVFTHNISFAPDLYLWLRRTLVGEMTPTKTGWPRIFIQSQAYSAIAFFTIFWFKQSSFKLKEFWRSSNILALLAAGGFLSAILISFSRSFWVALFSALAISLIALWYLASFKKMLTAGVWLILSGLLSFAFIYLVVAFPYIHLPSTDFSANLLDRVSNGNEAALASRWSLLPVLFKEIKQEPLLGQGYGATVTYFSSDPRILQNNPSGEYTTYAFEWGYLDLWLKLGILGLAAYLYLIIKLVIDAWRRGRQENKALFFVLATGIIFLAVTHIFTPYLNHPLGIGFVILSSCLIWSNRVY